jgi:PGF-CTERM protein
MRKMGMAVLASVLAGLLLLAALPASASAGLAGFQYQREIVIHENSGETLRDYQVLVALAGSDFPEEAEVDGDDIRFMDADGRELSYWIEEFDAGSEHAMIWVKVPLIPANGEAMVAMWYGNPGAASESDGEAVFEFFDDFEGAYIDEIKWHVNYGMPSISHGVLSLNGECVLSEKVEAFGYNYIFESFSKVSDAGGEPRSFLRSTNDHTAIDGSDRFEFGSWMDKNKMQLANVNDGEFLAATKTEKFPTSFEVLGMARSNIKTESFQNYVPELMNRENVPDRPLYLQLYSWGGETHYIDWARVRKYAPSKPTVTLSIPAPMAIATAPPPTPRASSSVQNASVQLHGEKTNVVLGEDILLKLSAVNLITKPTMHVQVIVIPPSGMSVTSSAFAKSGAGQYTTTYELEPGSGKDIEVAIRSNQVGDFDVNGRIIYYFGDDRDDAEDHTLTLPITVRAEPEQGADRTESSSESKEAGAPGFAAVVAIAGLLAAYLRRKRA